MKERVAIVGSRDFEDRSRVYSYINALPLDTVVVSGGARGVDLMAETQAKARGMEVVVYRPEDEDLPTFRQRAYRRNVRIAEDCDRLVAFWSGRDGGTNQTVGAAVLRGKPVEVIR